MYVSRRKVINDEVSEKECHFLPQPIFSVKMGGMRLCFDGKPIKGIVDVWKCAINLNQLQNFTRILAFLYEGNKII